MMSDIPVDFIACLCMPYHAGGETHTVCYSKHHTWHAQRMLHFLVRLLSVINHSEYRRTKESEWDPQSFLHHTGTDKTSVHSTKRIVINIARKSVSTLFPLQNNDFTDF